MEYKRKKMPINYQNALIYKLECCDPNITDIYIGSTCNFNRRKTQHKYNCIKEQNKDYNIPVYQYIRETGGWYNWKMLLVKQIPARDKRHLNKIEAKYIRELGAKLNSAIPLRTKKEYYQENKEILTEKKKIYVEKNKKKVKERKSKWHYKNRGKRLEEMKKYREKNKEKLREKNKEYRKTNKQALTEKKKIYYKTNKQNISEKHKEYCEKNKNKIAQYKGKWYKENKKKITERGKQEYKCPCGSIIRKYSKPAHEKSKKHQEWVNRPEPNLIFID